MSDQSRKPSIPAWQKAKPFSATPDEPQTTTKAEAQKSGSKEVEGLEELVADGARAGDQDQDQDQDDHHTASPINAELDQVDSLLKEARLEAATPERKRAFLEAKSIPKDVMNQALQGTMLSTSDFQNFQAQVARNNDMSASSRPVDPTPTTAPIITYPEFLVQAHKPPPLITPERVLSATYVASGIAAILYGANKFLVTPMLESLTECRHDFASHSQGKLDEFNERLSKIVTKIPSTVIKEQGTEGDVDEVDSITSDPTELFHRDMGTQTSPVPSRRSSLSASTTQPRQSAVEYQTNGLRIMKERLTQVTLGLESGETSESERQDNLGKLRHYLDTLLYASPALNLWGSPEDLNAKPSANGDAVDELKREIRSVKGVLLSARRFPGPTARAGA